MKRMNRESQKSNQRRMTKAEKRRKKRAAARRTEQPPSPTHKAFVAYYGDDGHMKGVYCGIHQAKEVIDSRRWVLSDDASRRTAAEEIIIYVNRYGVPAPYIVQGLFEAKDLPGAYGIVSDEGSSTSPFLDDSDPEIMGPDEIWDFVNDAIGGVVTDIRPIRQLDMNSNEKSLIPVERVEREYRTNAELRRAHDDMADIVIGKTTITLDGHTVTCLKSIENSVLSLTFMGKSASGVERILLIGRYSHRRNMKVWYETIDSARKIYRDEVYEVLAYDYQEPPSPYSLLFAGPKSGLYSDIMRDLIMLNMICILNFAKTLQGVAY